MYKEPDFIAQLRDMGIEEGDTLLVHSSMKSIGTDKRPEDIIEVLRATLGGGGTLLFPALSYASVSAEQPVFDSRTTPVCVGLLPRVFSGLPGVVRSLHPTHSVCACGKNAKEMTASHHLDETPVGPNSPFRRLPEYGGKILFIGDLLGNCTFMHGVEEIAGTDYTLQKERTHYIVDGTGRDLFAHDFAGWAQRYDRIREILGPGELRAGRFGAGIAWCVADTAALRDKGVQAIRSDVHFFVEREA